MPRGLSIDVPGSGPPVKPTIVSVVGAMRPAAASPTTPQDNMTARKAGLKRLSFMSCHPYVLASAGMFYRSGRSSSGRIGLYLDCNGMHCGSARPDNYILD